MSNEKTNPASCQTAVMRGAFPDWSDEKLKERLSELENEKEAIEFSISRIENEIFYREHPECVS